MAVFACIVAVLGCATQPQLPQAQSLVPTLAVITAPLIDSFAGRQSADIDVLTYNIRGLPPPLRLDAVDAMTVIAAELRHMQIEGTAPDIVLIQEGFLDDVQRIANIAEYPYTVSGPDSSTRDELYHDPRDQALEDGARFLKGETIGPVLGSGLRVFSRFPITRSRRIAYGRKACAGYDCLANKGALLFWVRIPGVPEEVQIFTTHMNSQTASGVSNERSFAAHRLQMMKLGAFLRAETTPELALIFGGDFNTKNAPPRRRVAEAQLEGFIPTHVSCAAIPQVCSMSSAFDLDRHWLESRDLQGYRAGRRVSVLPQRIGYVFDPAVDERALSDHAAIRATYRLSWPSTTLLARAEQ